MKLFANIRSGQLRKQADALLVVLSFQLFWEQLRHWKQ